MLRRVEPFALQDIKPLPLGCSPRQPLERTGPVGGEVGPVLPQDAGHRVEPGLHVRSVAIVWPGGSASDTEWPFMKRSSSKG